jgi:Protein-L-isoaspartate(D-aspartate) O-methyltransferase (PCMT)
MTTLIIPISPRRPPNYSSSPSFSSSSPASLLTLCRLLLLLFVLIGSLTLVSSQENSSSKACTAYQPSSSNINNKNIMRAWHCHGRTQKELVDRLRQANIVTSAPTQQVMELVDRQFYIQQFPYQDSPQPIEKSQTISAPHMHAHVLEEILPVLYKQHELHPQDDVKILDVSFVSFACVEIRF